MGAIIALIIFTIVILIILLSGINGRVKENQLMLGSINDKLKRISTLLFELNQKNSTTEATEQFKAAEIKEVITKPEVKPAVKQEAEIIKEAVPEKETAPAYEATPQKISEAATSIISEKKLLKTPALKNRDWEKFIGENLANKIGIAILLLGIAFFVKYAIDKNWINETGRVIIGLVCGGILIGFANYIRNNYRSFSSVLAGGGIVVFYFTIAFAFQEYQLIGQQPSFIIMIIITAFAVGLSILYDRLELAVLASIGGFVTPFLLSTGQDNYIVLFTYIAILNAGLMILAYYKRWSSVNFIALFFTVILFGGWLVDKLLLNNISPFPYKNLFFFASLFYAEFVVMNIIHQTGRQKPFKSFDFITLLSINLLYYTAGTILLQQNESGDYKGIFTALLGVVNLLIAWIFFKNSKVDKNFLYLLIGLTLSFISLAAPVQLKGNHITLFWAAESVVIFWLYQRSRISLLKIASLGVAALMIFSLIIDWQQVYFKNYQTISIIANKGFITSVAGAASIFIYHYMMRTEANYSYIKGISNNNLRAILLFAGIIILYISGILELYFQFATRLPGTLIYAVYLQLYTFLFTLLIIKVFNKSSSSPVLRIVLTLLSFITYCYFINTNNSISWQMLTSGNNRFHFIFHWISAGVLFYLLYALILFFRKNISTWKAYENTFTWIAAFGIVLMLSTEIRYAFLWINGAGINNRDYWGNLYNKAGLSIVWGICSFIMMWLGMKSSFRTLRIISLTLFSITLVKLFLYDIKNMPPGGKIAAFILLGILLLVVSFMYQRLKKIIIDDSKKDS